MILDLSNNELYLQSRKVLLPLDVAELDEVHRNAVFPGTMAMELTSLPSYERGLITSRVEDIVRNAFRSHYQEHPVQQSFVNPAPQTNVTPTHSHTVNETVLPPPVTGSAATTAGKQTVIGVFDVHSQAREAFDALLKNGIRRENIDLSYGDKDSAERESSISHFFHSLFSNDNEARTYTDAARTGSVITVHVYSRPEAELAADILDAHGAVNMEERVAADRHRTANIYENSAAKRYRSKIIDHGEQTQR